MFHDPKIPQGPVFLQGVVETERRDMCMPKVHIFGVQTSVLSVVYNVKPTLAGRCGISIFKWSKVRAGTSPALTFDHLLIRGYNVILTLAGRCGKSAWRCKILRRSLSTTYRHIWG